MRKYLEDNGLLAVPFDKGVCIMRRETYKPKLESLLQSTQFLKESQPVMRLY